MAKIYKAANARKEKLLKQLQKMCIPPRSVAQGSVYSRFDQPYYYDGSIYVTDGYQIAEVTYYNDMYYTNGKVCTVTTIMDEREELHVTYDHLPEFEINGDTFKRILDTGSRRDGIFSFNYDELTRMLALFKIYDIYPLINISGEYLDMTGFNEEICIHTRLIGAAK